MANESGFVLKEGGGELGELDNLGEETAPGLAKFGANGERLTAGEEAGGEDVVVWSASQKIYGSPKHLRSKTQKQWWKS